MTLDEAIKHAEEIAEEKERSAKLHQRPDSGVKGSGKRYLSYLSCASEHRQLAEWLRELQQWREFGNRIGQVCAEFLTDEQIEKLREVNADEDSD